ncbi:hypothetical protein WICPIJ_002783, partial [Wickerhamomyces pijperi]
VHMNLPLNDREHTRRRDDLDVVDCSVEVCEIDVCRFLTCQCGALPRYLANWPQFLKPWTRIWLVLKLESEVAIDDKRVIHEQVVDEFGPVTSELEIQVQETETTQLGRNLQGRDVHTLDLLVDLGTDLFQNGVGHGEDGIIERQICPSSHSHAERYPRLWELDQGHQEGLDFDPSQIESRQLWKPQHIWLSKL